jgi:propanol-preferring alcohol dehydrogenase
MKTMSLTELGLGHVDSVEADTPVPGPTQVLVKVLACGVCRTDLHVVDGEPPKRLLSRRDFGLVSAAALAGSLAGCGSRTTRPPILRHPLRRPPDPR